MPTNLCISIRFLQPYSHGRGDGGEPEWPPSPLRMYQSLVNAAAAYWNERTRLAYAVDAMEWLSKQPAPTVVAAIGVPSDVKYRLYVPDNVGDRVAKSWRGGNANASIADYRTEKDVRPVHLTGDAVHYLYSIADSAGLAKNLGTLSAAARSITHLGWGIDMVVGNVAEMTEEEAAKLPGERWRPVPDGGGVTLRVPKAGTLDALITKHEAFLNRLSEGGFKPVPPLTAAAFDLVSYRRDTDVAHRPWVAFSILKPDASGNRAFDTPRRCRDVAAWVRHATAQVCNGWPFGPIAGFVHGHDENGNRLRGDQADERFMYLPLPSIERRGERGNHVGSIRRVLIATPAGFQSRIDWIRRRLPGQELVWGERVVGLLNLLPTSDWVLRQYTQGSRIWSTITPVVLPGHDDRDDRKAERLLRKAFVDAGFSRALVDRIPRTGLAWRPVGFRAGVELASRYCLPDHMTGPRYHVRVEFPDRIRGPLVIGTGRYRGMGLFAADE